MRKAKPRYDSPEFHQWTLGESRPDAQVLDLEEDDFAYVGGVPEFYRSSDLLSPRASSLVGVLGGLEVNGEKIGLWNFASSSSSSSSDRGGCRETHPGLDGREVDDSCYTFNGEGYAVQNGLENYDSR